MYKIYKMSLSYKIQHQGNGHVTFLKTVISFTSTNKDKNLVALLQSCDLTVNLTGDNSHDEVKILIQIKHDKTNLSRSWFIVKANLSRGSY